MKIIFFALLLSVINVVYAQSVKIKFSNLSQETAQIYSLAGEKLTFTDSINGSQNIFTFQINGERGFYRIVLDKNKFLNFVYDGENIELTTDANAIIDSLQIIKSESNKIYYEFVKLNKNYKTKSELLNLILSRYPKDDEYYTITNLKLKSIKEEYNNFVDVTSQEKPNSFISRYVKSAQFPIVDSEISFENQLTFLKKHALDKVNFNDADLINSDAFTNKSIEYLTYYRNPQLPLELLEKEFMIAIDTILNKAKVNELVYKHVTEYLIDGFKKFGFDNVINYIVENYVIKDDICLDEKLETALERRIKQTRNFKVGVTVPNIVIPDLSGNTVDLSKIESEKILIVFYASWCPHCQSLLPEIYKLYQNQSEKKLEVLAISLDTTKEDWENFVKANGLNGWLNASDLEAWKGKSVMDYFIYATPTMFLIDKDKKLLGTPKTIEEIRAFSE